MRGFGAGGGDVDAFCGSRDGFGWPRGPSGAFLRTVRPRGGLPRKFVGGGRGLAGFSSSSSSRTARATTSMRRTAAFRIASRVVAVLQAPVRFQKRVSTSAIAWRRRRGGMAALAKAKDARTCGMAVVHVGLRCTPFGADTPPSAREEGEGRCTHTHVDGRPHPGSEEQRDVVVEDVDDVGEKVDVDDVDDDVDDVD